MIYLTAIGQPPGGSSTVHTYTQTIHRTTQKTIHTTTQKLGRVRAVPRLCGFYPGICLKLRKKHGKISVRVAMFRVELNSTENFLCLVDLRYIREKKIAVVCVEFVTEVRTDEVGLLVVPVGFAVIPALLSPLLVAWLGLEYGSTQVVSTLIQTNECTTGWYSMKGEKDQRTVCMASSK